MTPLYTRKAITIGEKLFYVTKEFKYLGCVKFSNMVTHHSRVFSFCPNEEKGWFYPRIIITTTCE